MAALAAKSSAASSQWRGAGWLRRLPALTEPGAEHLHRLTRTHVHTHPPAQTCAHTRAHTRPPHRPAHAGPTAPEHAESPHSQETPRKPPRKEVSRAAAEGGSRSAVRSAPPTAHLPLVAPRAGLTDLDLHALEDAEPLLLHRHTRWAPGSSRPRWTRRNLGCSGSNLSLPAEAAQSPRRRPAAPLHRPAAPPHRPPSPHWPGLHGGGACMCRPRCFPPVHWLRARRRERIGHAHGPTAAPHWLRPGAGRGWCQRRDRKGPVGVGRGLEAPGAEGPALEGRRRWGAEGARVGRATGAGGTEDGGAREDLGRPGSQSRRRRRGLLEAPLLPGLLTGSGVGVSRPTLVSEPGDRSDCGLAPTSWVSYTARICVITSVEKFRKWRCSGF